MPAPGARVNEPNFRPNVRWRCGLVSAPGHAGNASLAAAELAGDRHGKLHKLLSINEFHRKESDVRRSCLKAPAWVAGVVAGLSAASALAASPSDKVFTVANYPVEARAKDAVAAKEKAHADGQ